MRPTFNFQDDDFSSVQFYDPAQADFHNRLPVQAEVLTLVLTTGTRCAVAHIKNDYDGKFKHW